MAKFEEWPLEDVVLKRVMANGLAAFQLQFAWDTCANHRHEDRAFGSRQCKPLPKRRNTVKYQANKNLQPGERKDPPPPEVNDQKEWEVQKILL
jgi:hypothetical protein